MNKPRFPVYVISKGRYNNPYTIKFFLEDKVDFKVVIEQQEYEKYSQVVPKEKIIVEKFPTT